MDKLRIIVADDHELLCQALVCILNGEFEIVGTAANGRELVDAALSLHPDVIVSDMSMPLLSGPQAMQVLIALGHNIPFVFVSASNVIVDGGASFVPKADARDELVPAVRTAASGEVYLSHRHR